MDQASHLLRAFTQAGAHQRQLFLHGLVDHVTDDEAVSLDRFVSWKFKNRFDILGHLPPELQVGVVQHLDARECYVYTLVCRRWKALFLQCDVVVGHLISRYFPACDRDFYENKLQLLAAIMRTRYLHATGHFRTRITSSFCMLENKQFPAPRAESLRKGRSFTDLACSASTKARYRDTRPLMNVAPAGVITRYCEGRIAWQRVYLGSSIYVHDLHKNEHKSFSLKDLVVRGNGVRARLCALGNRLVIVCWARFIRAFDMTDGKHYEASMPADVIACATRDDLVLVATRGGDLYIWESLGRFVPVDMTAPDEQVPSQHSQHKPVQICSFHYYGLSTERCPPFIFHPRDHTIFFVVSCDPSKSLLTVYEFNNMDGRYACSRFFVHNFSHLQLHANSDGSTPLSLQPIKADSHGTIQLMRLATDFVDEPKSVYYIKFNALTCSFSEHTYHWPRGVEIPGDLDRVRSFSLHASSLWNGQLMYACSSDRNPTLSMQLLGLEEAQGFSPLAPLSTGKPLKSDSTERSRPIGDMSGFGELADIVRPRDIAGLYPTDHEDFHGVQYMCSFEGKLCTYEKGDHQHHCRKGPCPLEELTDDAVGYPINHFGHICQSSYYPDHCKALQIFVDDDFLVVITNWDSYTVFCLDTDGKLARDLQEQQ